ncbi:hypothetical protein [Listeria booriae]|uniref:hypothetical protein n=1 Tax=Listeria booriae TaxID=1552123 RepID=UPI001628F306|nr:hypothetical protein [Listeria booriae]MBC2103998.1 hypothetical protein [Listeria booriae]
MKRTSIIETFKSYVAKRGFTIAEGVEFKKVSSGGFKVIIMYNLYQTVITCYGGYQFDELIEAMREYNAFEKEIGQNDKINN